MPTAMPWPICRNATASPSCATAPATSPCGTVSPSYYASWTQSPLRFAADERLGPRQRFVIGELLGRALHVIARRADERAADLAVERQLGAADRIDDHAGRVGRVPHFELQLDIERYIAEGRALEP